MTMKMVAESYMLCRNSENPPLNQNTLHEDDLNVRSAEINSCGGYSSLKHNPSGIFVNAELQLFAKINSSNSSMGRSTTPPPNELLGPII